MSILGQGVVAIWNGIAPEGREQFYEWHNREHMPERVGIPGFIRGRRYIARYGHPEYFTLYEAQSPEVLTGQDYFTRLNNPTPWTKSVVPKYFRDASRGVCRVKFSQACGDGGCLLTLQFGPAAGREVELEIALRHRVLPPIIDIPSVLGVHLCVADQAASDVETAERKGRTVVIPKWLIMIEAGTPEAADAACDAILAAELTKLGAEGAHDRGLYVLQNLRTK
ncbi:MAG TPA: hypothetical protein VIV09_03810 [Pseudolabrys sp.]|jgi:hypothetical protein